MLKLKHFSIALLTAVVSILASNVYAIHLDADLSKLDKDHVLTVEYSLVFSNHEQYTIGETELTNDFIKNFNDKFANKTPTEGSYIIASYTTPGHIDSCRIPLEGVKNVHLSLPEEGGCSIVAN